MTIKKKVYELLEEFLRENTGMDLDDEDLEVSDELMKDWEFEEEDVEDFYEVLNEEFGTNLSFPETDDKLSTIIEEIEEATE